MQDTSIRLWKAVLGEIELTLSRGNYITWFKKTQLIQVTDDEITVGVPNVFIKQHLEQKYTDLLRDTLAKNGVKPNAIRFSIINEKAPTGQHRGDTISFNTLANKKAKKKSNKPQNTISHTYRKGLNAKYTFENFIVGSGNDLAYAACRAIADQPGKKYNPLFVYGGVGIGKTHLIQAVGNEIQKTNPQSKVVYISSEQFVQEFLHAIRYKKIEDFTAHYRSSDVLIIDDIQFIAGKEKTQEEFFHTFNALHQANKQIIVSSDKPPGEIPTLEDRLRSRFAWGMAIDMRVPDFETRCAIVQIKSQEAGLELTQDVIEYLAQIVTTNIRELEGVLNQLIAFCEMRGLAPDIQTAETILGGRNARPKHISPKHIVEKTARYFSVSIDELKSPRRDKDIVYPRQIAMYMLRSELHLSFPKIAKELGRKDHTTALHSVDKITKESGVNAVVRQQLSDIRGLLYA